MKRLLTIVATLAALTAVDSSLQAEPLIFDLQGSVVALDDPSKALPNLTVGDEAVGELRYDPALLLTASQTAAEGAYGMPTPFAGIFATLRKSDGSVLYEFQADPADGLSLVVTNDELDGATPRDLWFAGQSVTYLGGANGTTPMTGVLSLGFIGNQDALANTDAPVTFEPNKWELANLTLFDGATLLFRADLQDVSVVPEPATLSLAVSALCCGIVALTSRRRRARRCR